MVIRLTELEYKEIRDVSVIFILLRHIITFLKAVTFLKCFMCASSWIGLMPSKIPICTVLEIEEHMAMKRKTSCPPMCSNGHCSACFFDA